MILNIGDLDLDLQGQIGLETYKQCVITCETFEPLGLLASNLSSELII